jgi:hypothetical protein
MKQTAENYEPLKKISKFPQLDKTKILSLSPSEKIKYTDSIRISYPILQEMLSLVADCHNSSKTQARPTCMRVSGASGTGKSNLHEIYSKKYPVTYDINGTNIPVIPEYPAQHISEDYPLNYYTI